MPAPRVHGQPDRDAKRPLTNGQFNQIDHAIGDFLRIQRRRGELSPKILGYFACGTIAGTSQRIGGFIPLLEYWSDKGTGFDNGGLDSL